MGGGEGEGERGNCKVVKTLVKPKMMYSISSILSLGVESELNLYMASWIGNLRISLGY